MWLDHLSLTLDLFIKSTDEIKEHSKWSLLNQEKVGEVSSLLEKQEDILPNDNNEGEEELLPLMVSRSVSLPLTPGQKHKQMHP